MADHRRREGAAPPSRTGMLASGLWPITKSAASSLVCVFVIGSYSDWLIGEPLTGADAIMLFLAVTVGGLVEAPSQSVIERMAFNTGASLLIYMALMTVAWVAQP